MSDLPKPRVLVVTVVHTPLDARIHHRQIRAMRDAGWSVTYAAPFAAYGVDVTQLVPGTMPIDLPRSTGRTRLRALRAARYLIRQAGPSHDVILLHDPELLLAVAGLTRRHRIVLDVHEDLAGSLRERTYLPRVIRPLASWSARWMERWAERHVELMLAEERYSDRFERAHPVVRNLPWLRQAGEAPRRPDPVVVYLGRISRERGARELIEVGRRLRDLGGPHLELIGPADADIEQELRAADDQGALRWLGFVPNEEALARISGAIAGLSLLYDTPNYRVSMPTKVLEYLACGVPVITTPLPAAAQLVRAHRVGIVTGFGDVDAVVRAVESMARDPSERERYSARAHSTAVQYSWQTEVPAFLAALADTGPV